MDEHQTGNELEKEIEDLREWQDNQHNPGYFVGTGRIPRPIRKSADVWYVPFILGVLFSLFFVMQVVAILSASSFEGFSPSFLLFSLIFSLIVGVFGVKTGISQRKHKRQTKRNNLS